VFCRFERVVILDFWIWFKIERHESGSLCWLHVSEIAFFLPGWRLLMVLPSLIHRLKRFMLMKLILIVLFLEGFSSHSRKWDWSDTSDWVTVWWFTNSIML
jgi:hypothetical protein